MRKISFLFLFVCFMFLFLSSCKEESVNPLENIIEKIFVNTEFKCEQNDEDLTVKLKNVNFYLSQNKLNTKYVIRDAVSTNCGLDIYRFKKGDAATLKNYLVSHTLPNHLSYASKDNLLFIATSKNVSSSALNLLEINLEEGILKLDENINYKVAIKGIMENREGDKKLAAMLLESFEAFEAKKKDISLEKFPSYYEENESISLNTFNKHNVIMVEIPNTKSIVRGETKEVEERVNYSLKGLCKKDSTIEILYQEEIYMLENIVPIGYYVYFLLVDKKITSSTFDFSLFYSSMGIKNYSPKYYR